MKKIIFSIICFLVQQVTFAQLAITPPSASCILGGNPYSYGLTGITWTTGTTMHWSMSNGVKTGTSSTSTVGTPLPNLSITWSTTATSGWVKLYTDNPGSSEVTLPVTIVPVLQAGTITTGTQNINYNAKPDTIKCPVAIGGSCTPSYAYQWQQSANGTSGWGDVPEATAQNLVFASGFQLQHDTYYRRAVTESGTTVYSTVAAVLVVLQPIVTGTISPTYQLTNTYTGAPKDIVAVPATEGAAKDGLAYQWQQLVGSTWTDITGATGTTFNPGYGQPTSTTYYRLKVTDGSQNAYYTTDTIASQNSRISGPVDCWTGQTVTYSYINHSGISHPRWTLPINASLISDTTSYAFTIKWIAPIISPVTVYFRYDSAGTTYELSVNVNVRTIALDPGNIWYPSQLVEQGSNFYLSATPAIGGTGVGGYSYKWQQSTNDTTFTDISGQTSDVLSISYYTFPQHTMYYRRKVTSNSVDAYTDTATFNIYDYFSPGTITATDTDSIPWNTAPQIITGTTPTGGQNSNYTYQWQYSTDGTNYINVPNNGLGKDLQADKLATTVFFRRAVTNANTTRYTPPNTIKVKKVLFNPGSVSSSVLTMAPGGTSSLTGSAATGGSVATYSYQWQQSYDEVNWANCASGATQNFTTPALNKTTYYRRYVTNGPQNGYAYTNTYFNTLKVKVVPGFGSTIIPTTTSQSMADSSITAVGVTPYTLASITSAKINYVRTWDVSKPAVTTLSSAKALTSVTDAQQVTAYFDDLGRPVQTVAEDATPDQKDLVTVENYDILGRQVQQYLPYTDNTTTGDFKTDAVTKQPAFYNTLFSNKEGFYYSNTTYEASPLNRPIKQTAPGKSWTGNNVGVRTDYTFNTVLDSVVQWTIGNTASSYPVKASYYDPGDLVLLVTTDEHENKVLEYKDNEGKVILKKVQVDDLLKNGHDGWACTYYVYDVFNRLRYVLQPNAVDYALRNSWSVSSATIQNELCFQYQYDTLGRMISKRVPGSGITYLVYDKRNRPVFTQDSVERANNQWLGTIYDDQNRPVETGMLSYSGGYTALQNSVNSNTGSGTYTAPSISGNTTPTLMNDLTVTTRQTGQTLYQAGNTIVFDNGFTSETAAEFTTQLGAQVQDSFNDTMNVLDNPVPSGYTFTPLTITNYDDYSETSKTYTSANNSIVDNGANSYAYALPTQAYPVTTGMITNTKVRILQSTANIAQGGWIEAATFYDDKGRPVQVQTTNASGEKDTLITQFTFAGLPLNALACEAKGGLNPLRYRTITRNNYDATWRETSITKKINNSLQTTVASNTYNQLGQLVAKRQGQQRNTDFSYSSAALDTLDYSYNIRGWMAGINRGYANPTVYTSEASAQSNRWFGMELAYDFGFTNQQLNGNIGGIVWRNSNDGEQRAYGFVYDNLNRLTRADFTQNAGSYAWNVTGGVDYSVHSIGYDLNGNILKMNQMGLLINSSMLIDSLVYNYVSNSNKLNYVTEKKFDTSRNLGDFTEINNTATQDYLYDGNGSLTKDDNKNISSIHYNHLNLPDSIVVTGKGYIRYVYNAAGNKLQKIVADNVASKKTVTSYTGSGVYQYSSGLTATSGTDTLQYLGQEEGRVRAKTIGKTDTLYYDYFVKDHLGNTRTVLTDELQTDYYPDASLEDANIANEKLYYTGIDTGRVNKSTVSGYPSDTYTNPNNYIQKLNGNGPKIGSGILLHVMAGDKITVRANSWWNSVATPGTPVSPISNIVDALLGSLPATTGSKVMQNQLTSGILTPDVTGFLTTRDANGSTAKPKAYLNVVLLDERLNFYNTGDGNNSYFEQVGVSGALTTMGSGATNRKITKSGYLYIYVSNETPNIDVFFDNLQVTHTRGPLLETDNYYPFGLVQSSISSSAEKLENKIKFGGKEIQHNEFGNAPNLETYDFGARSYDPQVGRWDVVDPSSNKYVDNSPYNYTFNNPIKHIDPDGKDPNPFRVLWDKLYRNFVQNTTAAFLREYALKVGFQEGICNICRVGKIYQAAVIGSMGENENFKLFRENPLSKGVRPDVVNNTGLTAFRDIPAAPGASKPERFEFSNAAFTEIKFKAYEDDKGNNPGQLHAMIDFLSSQKGGYIDGEYNANIKASDYGRAILTIITPSNGIISPELIEYATAKNVQLYQRTTEQDETDPSRIRIAPNITSLNLVSLLKGVLNVASTTLSAPGQSEPANWNVR